MHLLNKIYLNFKSKKFIKGNLMKFLIVEDDFLSRKLLNSILSKYADCDFANDGNEAIKAYKASVETSSPYDVIFLDIMMPGKDGYDVLKEIRKYEKAEGIGGKGTAKIIMTTALDEPHNVMRAFKEQCEAYLIKPITEAKIVKAVKDQGIDLQKRIIIK